MGYYAAYLDVTGKKCLLIGDGAAAQEKMEGLIESGASVVRKQDFDADDLDGCFLVIDASQDEPTGERVAAAARARGVLVNVLDRPALCDFIAPALVRRGPLQIAISTSGRSPFMASHIRRLLEKDYGQDWGLYVELVGELRDRLRAEGTTLKEQQRIYARIPDSGALQLLRGGDVDGARRAIATCAAPAPARP